jgi:putative transposase
MRAACRNAHDPQMARPPRLDLVDIPQHIVQRGNDRALCFRDDTDRRGYLAALGQMALRYGCAIHAYVLMNNHVHLLVTPAVVGAVSRMMQAIGSWYVPEFNLRHGRTGTLWEGRYRSCLVDTDSYLLACYRYIELNPVRAAIVAKPWEYRWSSYAVNAGAASSSFIRPHETFLALGETPAERGQRYRELFHSGLPDAQLREIRAYTQQQRALGSTRFQMKVGAQVGRCVALRPNHRPPGKKVL